MRNSLALPLALKVTLALFVAPIARAESKETYLHKEQLGVGAMADSARARARAGDCEGALYGFDAALRVTTDPVLRRDRGICHDKLHHPFPAVDDFRAYLTAMPDAPDADRVRARLAELEEEIETGKPASRGVGESDRAKKVEPRHHPDEDESSSLRRGFGFAFAPFVGLRGYLKQPYDLPATDFSENVGLSVRHSVGRFSTMLLDAAYQHFNTTDRDGLKLSGVSLLLGYEARIRTSVQHADNWFLLGGGLGYDHISATPGTITGPLDGTLAGFFPRARIGYRQLFGARAGLEITGEAGALKYMSISGGLGDSEWLPVLALNLAVALAAN